MTMTCRGWKSCIIFDPVRAASTHRSQMMHRSYSVLPQATFERGALASSQPLEERYQSKIANF
jgi:hypothetical protein